MSKRMLFILDLDGALLCRLSKKPEKILATKHPNYVKPNFKFKGEVVFVRPGLKDFLSRIFKLGDVAVWTPIISQYAVPLVVRTFYEVLDIKEAKSRIRIIETTLKNNKVLRMTHKVSGPLKLQFLWTRAHCEVISPVLATSDGTSVKISSKAPLPLHLIPKPMEDLLPFEKRAVLYAKKKLAPKFIKNLDRVLRKHPQYCLEQVVLIDDSAENCRHEQHRIENHISLPPFKVLDPKVNHTQDRCLSDLAAFLESQLVPTIEDGLAGEAGNEVDESLAIRNEEESVVSSDVEEDPECNEEEDEEKDSVGDLDDDYLDDYDSKLQEMSRNVLARARREVYTGIAAKDLVAAYRKSLLVDGNTANLT
eukprot:gene29210-38278_t